MPIKSSDIETTDMFAGCGGSSDGAEEAGAKIRVALNHWELAVETHNTNFPEALHDCADISASDPRRYPSTELLIASPECTNHSLAKGKKILKKQMNLFASGKLDPAAERSRATMWDVPRFAEYHNYNIIIVENVVDARKWVMFDSWLLAMQSMGYMHRCLYLNSMHFPPTPQSRDRMYVYFWKKGNRAPMLDYTPPAYCPKCSRDVQAIQTWKKADVRFGKYKQQYVYCCPGCAVTVEPYYYAAFNAIDWSDRGQRIGDRKYPLAEKSVTRIEYGIDKHGSEPFQVISYTPGYTKSIDDSMGTLTTNDHHGLCVPFIINDCHTSGVECRVRPIDEKLDTVTGSRFGLKLITPPFIVENKGGSKAREITKPLATQTSKEYLGLITTEAFNSFITSFYGGSNCTKHISQELGSITTGDRHALVNYQKPNIEDCFYRMLKPVEVQRGMAFRDDYKILGNNRDKVKQLGNAVTPPAMKWLVEQAIKSLS